MFTFNSTFPFSLFLYLCDLLDRNLKHETMSNKNSNLHCIIFSNMVFVMKKVIIVQALSHKVNYIINTLITTPHLQNTGRKLIIPQIMSNTSLT